MSQNPSQKDNGKASDSESDGDFDVAEYFRAKLRPQSRVLLPIPRDAEHYVARVETLEAHPPVKKELLDKKYAMFMSQKTIEVDPTDAKDDLYSIFLERIAPAITEHNAGHMSHSEFASFLSQEYVRIVHFSTRKELRFCDDPSLLGGTYFNQEDHDNNRKFTTTWRSFADLDK